MPIWLIILIVIIVVVSVIIIIAVIVVAITVPLLLLQGGEAEICPDCNGNVQEVYIAKDVNGRIDIDNLSALNEKLVGPLTFGNDGNPILHFCDTSFPNSVAYWKATDCSTTVGILTEPPETTMPLCENFLIGYALDTNFLSSQIAEQCCRLSPQGFIEGTTSTPYFRAFFPQNRGNADYDAFFDNYETVPVSIFSNPNCFQFPPGMGP